MTEVLIQAIKERQEAEGLTLTQMSKKLGIAVSYLSMVYNGKRPPADKMLHGIIKCYPELTDQVSLFLLNDITGSQDTVAVSECHSGYSLKKDGA